MEAADRGAPPPSPPVVALPAAAVAFFQLPTTTPLISAVQKHPQLALPAAAAQTRSALVTIPQVAANEAGLRQLAAAGAWSAVTALAERLESDALDAVTRLPTELSLRFATVRVQAYFSMRQFDQAKRVYDLLGNFNESRFYVPASATSTASLLDSGNSSGRRSIVPFSLVFLRALLPGLLPQPQPSTMSPQQQSGKGGGLLQTQTELYKLLNTCDEASSASPSSQQRLLWRKRAQRVRRALISNHFELQQFSVSLTLLRDLAECETSDIRHLLTMQQLGAACLASGNVFLAVDVFRMLEKYPVDDESLDDAAMKHVVEMKMAMVALNQALILSFYGHFTEASLGLRNVFLFEGDGAAQPTPPSRDMVTVEGTAITTPASSVMADEAKAVLSFLRRCAATSLTACLPFILRNDAPDIIPGGNPNPSVPIPTVPTVPTISTSTTTMLPKSTVAGLVAFVEDCIRLDPVGFLSLEPFLVNATRLFDLEGAASNGGSSDGMLAAPASSSLSTSSTTADAGSGGSAAVVSNTTSTSAISNVVSRQERLEALVECFRGAKEAAAGLHPPRR